MKVKFDNIDDVVAKFHNTICIYDGLPVRVENVVHSEKNQGSFALLVKHPNGGPATLVEIDDPKLLYRDYNLGYANIDTVATWWYRRPLKQYQQGLKRNQVSCLCTSSLDHIPDDGFGFTKNYIKMLSNIYPTLDECRVMVTEGNRISAAFHRDFAISFNHLHGTYTLEFRGKRVGISPDLKTFKLAPNCEHLSETLQEVLTEEKIKAYG